MKNKNRTIFLVFILFLIVILSIKPIGRKLYPLKYYEDIYYYSKIYSLDPLFVTSVIYVESKFNEMAVSRKGAIGLMQILPRTAKWAAKEMNLKNYNNDLLFDIKVNINIGCWYLNRLRKQFSNIEVVLAAYNGGSGNVSKWLKNPNYSLDEITLEKIPFEETSNFVKRVKRVYRIYKFLYS